MRFWPLGRELILAASMIMLLLAGIYGVTGNSPPIVVVESSSMMHDPGGQIGAIDAGDLVMVHSVDKRRIVTYAEASDESNPFYGRMNHGLEGDVIVYAKNGEDATPIIHRAVIYARANLTATPERMLADACEQGSYDAYQHDEGDAMLGTCVLTWDVPGTTIRNDTSISWNFTEYRCDLSDNGAHAQYLKIINWNPGHQGYLTLGDNNNCNVDQGGRATANTTGNGLSDSQGNTVTTVTDEWLEGVAGAEIPWFGAVKLMTMRQLSDDSPGTSQVPGKSWFSLMATVFVLLALPMAIEPLANRLLTTSPEAITHGNESLRKGHDALIGGEDEESE